MDSGFLRNFLFCIFSNLPSCSVFSFSLLIILLIGLSSPFHLLGLFSSSILLISLKMIRCENGVSDDLSGKLATDFFAEALVC